jgi:hypothetical protein
MKQPILCVIFATLIVAPLAATWPVEETSTYCKKERINDVVFVYRHEIANGVVTTLWTIDGRPVGYDEFVETQLNAEMALRRAQRLAEHQQKEQELATHTQCAMAGSKRLLTLTVAQVEEQLNKLRDYRLENYFVFGLQTVASREALDALINRTLPEAKKLAASDTHATLAQYQQMVTALEGVPEKLSQLVYATANNAMQQCTDTRILKDLLTLIT